jgi:hypothetical protein
MTEGKIPVSEALHYSMSLAEALRKMHDGGKAHGALTPASIVLNGKAVELIPSMGALAAATPYTAPEVVQGQPADARSDIFSFGALVFEMLTGRRAFEGASQTELKLALCNAAPPSSGSPAVDRLVVACVAKSPAARWQRMQKIIMELKLLSVAARRADAPAATRGVSDTALRAEMQELEARLALRLANYEKTIAAMQQSAGEAADGLKEQLAGVHAQLAAIAERPSAAPVDVEGLMQKIEGHVQETVSAVTQQIEAKVRESAEASSQQHSAQMQEALGALKLELAGEVKETIASSHAQHAAQVQESLAAATEKHTAQVQESIAAATEKHAAQVQESIAAGTQRAAAETQETVTAVNQRLAAAEANMEEIRKHFATLQANVAGDLHDFENTLKAQGVAIDSARTAMAQTDDLVERVVEALELLQSSIMDQHEAAGVN